MFTIVTVLKKCSRSVLNFDIVSLHLRIIIISKLEDTYPYTVAMQGNYLVINISDATCRREEASLKNQIHKLSYLKRKIRLKTFVCPCMTAVCHCSVKSSNISCSDVRLKYCLSRRT